MSDCLFCRIANGQIPVDLVYQDELAAAFRDINPQAPTHILIVPKAHVPDMLHAANDSALMGHLFRVAADLAKSEGLVGEGFRVVINTGQAAGQTVAHLHLHLLGGREFGWPPG